MELPNLEAVRLEAIRHARKLLVIAVKRGVSVEHCEFRVRDASTGTVLTVPFADALEGG